jgi:murein L,D-transpeptidase YcbB/YkuD
MAFPLRASENPTSGAAGAVRVISSGQPAAPALAPSRPAAGLTLPSPTSELLQPQPLLQGVMPEAPGRPREPAATPDIPARPSAANPPPTKAQTKPAARPAPDPAMEAQARLARRADPRPVFTPDTFALTLKASETYAAIAAAGGWPILPAGITLAPGATGPLVAALRQRLAITGDLPASEVAGDLYDPALQAAVRRFQDRHGLSQTGIVGPRTLIELNVPATTRQIQLANSALRLAGSIFAFGERYVAVNIPSAQVEAVANGQVERRYLAVVGRPDRPSPTVETRITNINFNPTWTVPPSIVRKDIIPKMRKDPSYLAKARIRIFNRFGEEIEPSRIDWSTERAADFTLRQDPGPANALGVMRIDMPNREAVYMHDTPQRRLFARDDRFNSSGCVRVADVRDLAAWLLSETPGWDRAKIDATIASDERKDIRLQKPVPVAWLYLTGFALADGSVQFRPDIYGLDVPGVPAPVEPAPVAGAPMTSAPVAGAAPATALR